MSDVKSTLLKVKDLTSNVDEMFEHEGQKIILPALPNKMKIKDAIKALELIMEEQETVVQINEQVEAFPLEGAYAMVKAMQRLFGWATPLPGNMFQAPPTTISLEVSHNVFAQVIWGRFTIPGIEGGEFESGMAKKDGRVIYAINGKAKKKFMPLIKQLADETRRIVVEESIYRGKALRLPVNENGQIFGGDMRLVPKFIDLSKVNESEMVYTEETLAQITTNMFTPVTKTSQCRAAGVPLKRGVLLEGPFGTGKTLAAYVLSKKCAENGWTFIMIDRVAGLKEAMRFARAYQPAVVFAEDIDREAGGQERTQDIDDVLNTIDGVESKAAEIMVVLTSNEAHKINRAMLRPGRLDAVITIEPPDAAAAMRLIRIYGRDMIKSAEDLSDAGLELSGQIPAVIREVVERAKLYSITRNTNGHLPKVVCRDLVLAARQMKKHLSLLNSTDDAPKTKTQVFAEALEGLVAGAGVGGDIPERLTGISSDADGAHEWANAAAGYAEEGKDRTKKVQQGLELVDKKVAAIGKSLGISLPKE